MAADDTRRPTRAHILASINPFVGKREADDGGHTRRDEAEREARRRHRERKRRRRHEREDGEREAGAGADGSRRGDDGDGDEHGRRQGGSGGDGDTDRRGGGRRHGHRREGHHRTRRRKHRDEEEEGEDPYADPPLDADAAFRQSLFDAMADDEGAAYWEAVYGQPVRAYAREAEAEAAAAAKDVDGLAAMTDDEYVDYVRRRMWERSREGQREAREAQQRQRAQQQQQQQQKQQQQRQQRRESAAQNAAAAADRARWAAVEHSLRRGDERRRRRAAELRRRAYADAWTAWEAAPAADTIPWPLVADGDGDVDGQLGKDTATNTRPTGADLARAARDFFARHADADDDQALLRGLRDERVRWHPDKIQQRLGGCVDAAVMRDVTAVFQAVDGLLAETRSRTGKR